MPPPRRHEGSSRTGLVHKIIISPAFERGFFLAGTQGNTTIGCCMQEPEGAYCREFDTKIGRVFRRREFSARSALGLSGVPILIIEQSEVVTGVLGGNDVRHPSGS